MIYLTGDTHGDMTRLSEKNFPDQKNMTKDDFVIVLGDFGLVWCEGDYEKKALDELGKMPFTTLFIDGNHENYDLLNDTSRYPIEDWNGGKIQRIRPSVIHLMRGEVFTLQEKTFFTFGGARSHDIDNGIIEPDDEGAIYFMNKIGAINWRINHVSWWKEELPSDKEMKNGMENLKKHGNKVDYILTHSPSASMNALLGYHGEEPDILMMYLEEIHATVDYKRWYFGHVHQEKALNAYDITMYESITRIE